MFDGGVRYEQHDVRVVMGEAAMFFELCGAAGVGEPYVRRHNEGRVLGMK